MKVSNYRQAERASVREKKPAPATKTKASSLQKAADAKKMFRKRKKQYQHIMTLLRAVIRIVNAAGRSTMYRR